MKKLSLLLLNTVSFGGTIYMNYHVNAQAETSIGEISDTYATLITPADYAFAIWGVIYLGLLVFLAFQWYQYLTGKKDDLEQIGIWFIVSNLANALWVAAFLNQMIDTSVIIMFLLLLSLIKLMIRLRLEIWDAPVRIIAAVWWPIAVYLGWIVLASVVNVASWLVSTGWNGGPLSPAAWTIIMLGISLGIYLALIGYRNLRESAVVGIWGIVAIAMRLWESHPSLAYVCLTVVFILIIASGYHGFKNLKTSPLNKIRRGEF